MSVSTFEPRWASAPGTTITEALEIRGLDAEALADALGMSDPDARRLILGEIAITESTASGLAALLGGSESFWLEREKNYRESLTWLEADDFARQLPLKQMQDLGWIGHSDSWKETAASSLSYFDVNSMSEWNARYGGLLARAQYRTSPSYTSSAPALAVWLRQAALAARERRIGSWSVVGLQGALPRLRALSKIADPQRALPELIETCSSFGVALVALPAPQGCAASGAAFRTDEGLRVVVLSARHKRDDHFYFSLFHELGHLAIHQDELFVDEFDDADSSAVEAEADDFAASGLLPDGIGRLATTGKGPTAREVVAFAASEGIAPGIVVGQLQHAGVLRPNQLNGLKRPYKWDGSTLKSGRIS